jgi:hypothetical protein
MAPRAGGEHPQRVHRRLDVPRHSFDPLRRRSLVATPWWGGRTAARAHLLVPGHHRLGVSARAGARPAFSARVASGVVWPMPPRKWPTMRPSCSAPSRSGLRCGRRTPGVPVGGNTYQTALGAVLVHVAAASSSSSASAAHHRRASRR